ncbi:MAG: hypothetical protein SOX33_08245 [Agathobacter sp.]|nr:hypothetical protein [Agathobacter sp.]
MSAQSNTEKVLRSLHVLLSKSEPYSKEPTKVIVDKQQMLDLLSELNTCIYQIMEEHEMTTRSRDKAEREFRKKSDQIIWDASRKAEDIYAASVMYMDEALNGIQDIMRQANEAVDKIYMDMDASMKKEERRIKENQSELKSQLQDLVDTEKYLNLIEERNKELERQKNAGKPVEKKEASIYANRQTEIKVNQEYLDKLGLSVEDEADSDIEREAANQEKDEEELKELQAEIRIDLDADYFQWKEGQDAEKSGKTKTDKEKPERIQKMWKNLTGGKR